jgi:hypothetical protein
MKNMIEINGKNESEFSESNIEKEYKSMDLNLVNLERKSSTNYPKSNFLLKLKQEEKEEEIEDDDDNLPLNFSVSHSINYIKEDKDNETLPLSTLIFYSLPSFGKMSCLVLLNVNSTLYYESLGASLIYMSFFVILARSLEILVKPLIAHVSDEIKTKMGRRKPFMLIGCGFYALFLVLLFSPPTVQTTTKALSIWYGVFFTLFFLAESVTIPPYLALAPELSGNTCI